MLSLPRIKLPALSAPAVKYPNFTDTGFDSTNKVKTIATLYENSLTSVQKGLLVASSSNQPTVIENAFQSVKEGVKRTASSFVDNAISAVTGATSLITGTVISNIDNVKAIVSNQNNTILQNVSSEIDARVGDFTSTINTQGDIINGIKNTLNQVSNNEILSIENSTARDKFVDTLSTTALDSVMNTTISKLSQPTYLTQVQTINAFTTL